MWERQPVTPRLLAPCSCHCVFLLKWKDSTCEVRSGKFSEGAAAAAPYCSQRRLLASRGLWWRWPLGGPSALYRAIQRLRLFPVWFLEDLGMTLGRPRDAPWEPLHLVRERGRWENWETGWETFHVGDPGLAGAHHFGYRAVTPVLSHVSKWLQRPEKRCRAEGPGGEQAAAAQQLSRHLSSSPWKAGSRKRADRCRRGPWGGN